MAKVELLLPGFSLSSDQGRIAFCAVTLIRGSRTILVDTAHVGRRDVLWAALKAHGITPAHVDAVVLTHAHWDHIQNSDLFPQATHYLHPIERDYARAPHPLDFGTPAWTGAVLDTLKVETVQEGQEIDDGVRVLDTPGHSPGSISLRVETAEGPVCVVGDALPTGRSALQGTPPIIMGAVDDARASCRKLLDQNALIYPGHDRPFRIEAGRIQYAAPGGLRIFGQVDPYGPDISVTIGTQEPAPPFILRRE